MKFILNKKDIINMNEQFDEGNIRNEASLDFALSYAKKTENWTRALAYLVRAILIDHVFQEGNKRTAALLIEAYAEYEKRQVYRDKLLNLIKDIVIKNITSINKIEDGIKYALK